MVVVVQNIGQFANYNAICEARSEITAYQNNNLVAAWKYSMADTSSFGIDVCMIKSASGWITRSSFYIIN